MTKKAAKAKGDTPLMRQYQRIKEQHPDAVLLFRVGDFYETFGPDAVTASRVLGIVLTKRNNGGATETELAGFPYHALENYLPKLVRAGHRVAICDQLEDPKQAKTIVKRGVSEVVTPGVAFSDQVLDGRSNNWLGAVCAGKERYGIAFVDITTGEFLAGEHRAELVSRFIEGFGPSELLYPKGGSDAVITALVEQHYSYGLEDWAFGHDLAHDRLTQHFGTGGLKGFGLEDMPLAHRAAGAVLHYLGETRHDRLAHVNRIAQLRSEEHVTLDRATLRNLEVIEPVNPGARTLLQALDACVVPMGSRMLRRWLTFPLVDLEAIEARASRVQCFLEHEHLRERAVEILKQVGDLERLAAKAAAGRITPRELRQVHVALEAAGALAKVLESHGAPFEQALHEIGADLELSARIAGMLQDDPPSTLQKGGAIREGVNPELDELRHVSSHAKDLLLEVQQRESQRTGIPSLKVGFNNVFGYYLEVRNTHRDKVPEEWVRKQTLVSAERYITEELKELEERILGAEERILTLEQELFDELVAELCEHIRSVQGSASALAALDVLQGFAEQAARWGYVRPILDLGRSVDIRDGRHPVIEQQLPPGETYIANDVLLDPEDRQLVVVTGPNMSGKSALLRQTALIVLMAQTGSHVPASSAALGIVDRIFTRVGASDNLSTGESTFMVEMNETASILNNLTDRSLVVLDEIGRGTSTYDGISIAWSIAEFLHGSRNRPRTLFATHYHELNDMAERFPRIHNVHVAVREVNGKVLFLRKLMPGGTDRSFGIYVAAMSGMPREVVDRARVVLEQLEASHDAALQGGEGPQVRKADVDTLAGVAAQLSFFQLDDPALARIRDRITALDINTLTPVEALMELNEIKRMVGLKETGTVKA
ncbi:MAG: DNA mismatch repair protein MutS [Flavobacteriales bacterium]|nr:DNA mismatch repair protein MutS [Flavobacteriales bacterium]